MKFFFIFFVSLSISVNAQNADIDLLKNINLNRNKNLDEPFKTISNTVAPASFIVPLGVIGFALIKHDSTTKNKGIYIGASIAITAGITVGLKYAVNRPRPYVTYPFINNAAYQADPSFPSGHSSFAFSTATSLSLAFPKWYVIAPSFLWACSVGYSRLDLGVHYPSDVLVGATIGAGTSYLCYRANKWLYKRNHQK